ncbi:MAG: antitoxin [Dermatophilus congolensis]|nr:antitoxin [Dermatophilus congolensis]
MSIMRTTLSIDDDVLADARDIARAEGRSLGAVVSDLMRRALRPVGVRTDAGLPAFDVPPGAPTFGGTEVESALEDE